MAAFVEITKHTTASKPYPHVLYVVELCLKGQHTVLERRFSEFLVLHDALRDEFSLPPKRLLATTFLPSAWIDDELIAERKHGLSKYLSALLWSSEYRKHPVFLDFLTRGSLDPHRGMDIEDVLLSSLSRKGALKLASLFQEAHISGTDFSAAYYPEWSVGDIPPEKLDYTKFDILFFGFATPNASSTLDWGVNTEAILERLIQSAKSGGAATRIVLSIGGWEGSQWFSHVCSTSANRMTFVDAIVNAVDTYGLHGVDIDWEFPNWKGAGNPYSPNDTSNLLLLFQALRSALGPAKIISAAVGHSPWLDEDGLPLRDVSAFADELSFINIMNYSVYATSSPGPNAPLGNILLKPNKPQTTAGGAYTQWKVAGFPPSKMLLGLPLFGYVFKSSKMSLDDARLEAEEESLNPSYTGSAFKGAHVEAPGRIATDELAPEVPLAPWWGTPIPFKDIVKSGALVKRFDGNYGQGDGYTMGWDDPSATPYLFNVEKRTLVTFDNTRSLAAKVKFAKEYGMAGCFTWSLDQDDGYALQDVIRTALGK